MPYVRVCVRSKCENLGNTLAMLEFIKTLIAYLHITSINTVVVTSWVPFGILLFALNIYSPVSKQWLLMNLYSALFSLFSVSNLLLSVVLYKLMSEAGLLLT